MSRILMPCAIALLIVLSLIASPAGAAESTDTAPVVAAPSDVAPADHPLASEVQKLRESMRVRLEALETRRAGALSPEAELQLQREISVAKLDFELGMLELQLGHQEALGRKAAIDELSAAIDAVRSMREEIVGPVDDIAPHEDPAGDGAR